MKKFTQLMLCCATISTAVYSQTTVVDSIKTGTGYTNDVYYSLRNGEVKSTPNNDWQLALGIGVFNVSIRVNTSTGSSGDGSAKVYEMPGADTNQWANFDTTNYSTWQSLDNSDKTWDEGALNQNASSQFDYGWGVYNTATHVVSGHRLYLVAFKAGGETKFKKLWVLDKTIGVWHIKYADVDGSNEKIVEAKSADYAGKNFVYFSLVTDQIVDREPVNSDWDFVLTRYAAFQPSTSVYYTSTGILTNYGVQTAEVRNIDETNSSLADTIETSDGISIIGADWKQFNNQTFTYNMVDSLSYFVKAKDGAFWKLVFTEFVSSRGHVAFAKTKLTAAVGVNDFERNKLQAAVYPNPASDIVNVLFDAKYHNSTITITDISGKVIMQQNIVGTSFQNHTIDVSGFNKGFYFVQIVNGANSSVQKIILN